jgi:hypothetical protein
VRRDQSPDRGRRVAVAALVDLISEELRGWLELAPNAILRLGAAWLPPGQRETIYREEWLPELCYFLRGAESRPITRLIRGTSYAVDLLISARRIARITGSNSRTPTGVGPVPAAAASTATSPRTLGTPEFHGRVIARIPSVTGMELGDWFRRLESGPSFLRCNERARWLSEGHGLPHGYASAIVREYELRRRPAA